MNCFLLPKVYSCQRKKTLLFQSYLKKWLIPYYYEFMEKAKVFFLGTAGAVSTSRRDNTCFLLCHQERLILVDCPGSIIQKVKKLNINPSGINTILITHIHPDHVYGLPSFVHSLMQEAGQVNLFASEEAVKFCSRLLDFFNLRQKRIKYRINFHPLVLEKEVAVSPALDCIPLSVVHHSSSLGFKFRFKQEKKKLVYSGDTAVSSSLFEKAKGVDCLIHDCSAPFRFFQKYPSLSSMHTDALNLGRLAQRAKIKKLIPCHFFGELNYSLDEIREEIKRNYGGELVIPQDLEGIEL